MVLAVSATVRWAARKQSYVSARRCIGRRDFSFAILVLAFIIISRPHVQTGAILAHVATRKVSPKLRSVLLLAPKRAWSQNAPIRYLCCRVASCVAWPIACCTLIHQVCSER